MVMKECLSKARKDNWRVCVYGLGYMGKRLFEEIPGIFGLKADCYCDGDDEKVDNTRLGELQPMHISELLTASAPVLVFVLVDDPFDIEIVKKLRINKNLYVYSLRDLLEVDTVIKHYYGEDFYLRFQKLAVMESTR